MPFRAVLFGATGAAGKGVLTACLTAPEVARVVAVVRRPTGVTHDKLTEIAWSDFSDLGALTDRLTGADACFYCLGTSSSQAPDEKHYRELTETYALSAAGALKTASPQHVFHFLSGAGTNAKSRMMWARVKGETEIALQSFGLAGILCWRPAYIHPVEPRKDPGLGERFARALYPVLKNVEGMSVPARDLGSAMIEAQLQGKRSGIFENKEIRALARAYQTRTLATAERGAKEPARPGDPPGRDERRTP